MTYGAANSGFNPATATAMPTDRTLQSAITAACIIRNQRRRMPRRYVGAMPSNSQASASCRAPAGRNVCQVRCFGSTHT